MSSDMRALRDHRTAGYCSELARSTFRMEEDFGVARVFQQAGDETEVCSRAPLTPNPRPNIHAVNLTPIHHPHPNRSSKRLALRVGKCRGLAGLAPPESGPS